MEGSGPLVGRERELEFLLDQMSGALCGEGGLVLIAGEAGSGKTTLCEAFERMAARSGCLVLVGRCVPGSNVPYLPFMEAFHGRPSNPFTAPAAIGEGGKLLLSVLTFVEDLSNQWPLVLRLEDLHWADSVTIALMHFLARNVKRSKVLIIGTYRPEDVHHASTGEPHPLSDPLHIMRREGLCRELELQLLTPADTMRIVPLLLGGPADEKLMGHVATESRGNPLFAVEMIRYLGASEQLVFRKGAWRLLLKQKLQIPSTIREVIMARVESLPPGARAILETASVIGERFEPELIEASRGIERIKLLDDLEVLEKEYRLVHAEEGRYRFSHDKVRQVVYEGISLARKKELHRLIGLLLEQRLPNDELLGQLSLHFLEADMTGKCVKYSMAAGRYCRQRKAVREAKAFLLAALERTEGDQVLMADRLEALESLGDMKNDASSPAEWYSFYEQYVELCPDPRARARVMAKAAECWDQLGLGDPRKAYQLLDEAEAIADGDPLALAEIEYRRADLSSNEGKSEMALAQIAIARRTFESIGDLVGVSKCRELEIVILRQAFRFREARELAEAQLQAARTLPDPEPLLRVEMLDAFICAMTGDTAAAKGYAQEVIAMTSKLGMMWTYRLALHYLANALELEGEIEGARANVSKALDNALEYQSPFHAAMCEIDLGRYEAELGLLESAEGHYEEALRQTSGFDPYPRSLLDMDLSILQAELLWRSGRPGESDELFSWTIICSQELGLPYDVMNCCARYAMSLSQRGLEELALYFFEEAMDVAKRLGCEKKVRALAQRAGFSI